MSFIAREPMLVLTMILFCGVLLGQIRICGFALGSLGVLLASLCFGHFGLAVPAFTTDLGLLLFVFAVGLQAGPRFFRLFFRNTRQLLLLAIAPSLVALVVSITLGWLQDLPSEIIVGLFAASLTNTPALAAATDILGSSSEASARASVTYGVVFPVAMLVVIIAVQILPKLLRWKLKEENERWLHEERQITPTLVIRHLKVTNGNTFNKTIRELNVGVTEMSISRILRDGRSFLADADLPLHEGDIVTIAAPENTMNLAKLLIGEEVTQPIRSDHTLSEGDVEISESSLLGKRLSELSLQKTHRVLVTRIRRQGIEFIPRGGSILEFGDQVRVVGGAEEVQAFTSFAGSQQHLINETTMVPFVVGLFAAVLVGLFPIELFGDLPIRLGLAGGAFVVSVLMGHYGRIGPFNLYVPPAAKHFSRELGLLLFLAATGATAGRGLATVLANNGITLLTSGLLVSFAAIVTFLLISRLILKENALASLGGLCGMMNNSTGLSAIQRTTPSDLPGLTYTALYPVALIVKILLAEIFVVLDLFK